MKIWGCIKNLGRKASYVISALGSVFVVAILLSVFASFMGDYNSEEALERLDIIGLCIAGGVYLIEELKIHFKIINQFHQKTEDYFRCATLFSIICPLLGHFIHRKAYWIFSWVNKLHEVGFIYFSIIFSLIMFYIAFFILLVIKKIINRKTPPPQQPVPSNNPKDMNSDENHDDNVKIKKEKETIGS